MQTPAYFRSASSQFFPYCLIPKERKTFGNSGNGPGSSGSASNSSNTRPWAKRQDSWNLTHMPSKLIFSTYLNVPFIFANFQTCRNCFMSLKVETSFNNDSLAPFNWYVLESGRWLDQSSSKPLKGSLLSKN